MYKRDSLFHISNLIVKTDSLGNIVNDFIMDYGVREKDMFDYIFKHKNLNNFNGILSIYSTFDFTYNMSKNINDKSSEDFTDPCVTVNIGSSGGGGTSEDSINWYGYDYGGSSGSGIDEMSYLEFYMWLYGGEKTYINILSPRYFMITPNFIGNYLFGYSSTNGDPCSNITAGSYGLLAFNEEDIQNYLINIGIENCNQDMLNWIMNNESTFYQMVDLLYDEDYSLDAVSFVYQALLALINNQITSFDQIVIVDMPDNPFTDISEFLNCFDTTQPATLVVYSSEPNPGSGNTHSGNFVGHSFVRISQGDNICTVGFYPTSEFINPFNISCSSILGNDGGESFSVSVQRTITPNQLQNVINYVSNVPNTYNLNTYNCTDFAIQVGNLGGISLPDCFGTWPGGSGSNPGTLGQFIRTNPNLGTISTTAATALQSNKGC